MANKKIINSVGESYETDVAERMSSQFDKKYDVRDTFTLRMLSGIRGKSDDAVRQAVMMAMKKARATSANVKVRFTRPYAEEHMEELVELAKLIQLEDEARILEMRTKLSEEDQKNGKIIAFQNYAMMVMKSHLSSSVKDDTMSTALRATGNWYTPNTSVFTLTLDFAGLTPEKFGYNLEKEISVIDSNGVESTAYRIITEVGGAKSCPVNEANKDAMVDMLYAILKLYDDHFKTVDGSDMDQVLNALKNYVRDYRIHSNTELVDTKLTDSEKKEAEEWAIRAEAWIQNN